MKFLFILTLFIGLVAAWVVWIRPWLRKQSWGWSQRFFEWIEPIEIALWRKSETILWARLKMAVGVLLTVLTTIGALDITPIMPLVPDQYEGLFKTVFGLLPLVITLMGWIDEQLRKDTTKPLVEVELPAKVIAESPELAQAVAASDAAKMEVAAMAKVVVAEKKAEAIIEAAKTENPTGGDK